MPVDPWLELEQRLTQINSATMPPAIAAAQARSTIADVRSGSGGLIEPADFKGPAVFFRAASASTGAYSGRWWFEESLLARIDKAYSRIFFGPDKARAARAVLREALALSSTWNAMTELWMLQLPTGATLRGYRSRAVSQSLFSGVPVSRPTRCCSEARRRSSSR